jgi:transglutaminase-like putative cysteine protease
LRIKGRYGKTGGAEWKLAFFTLAFLFFLAVLSGCGAGSDALDELIGGSSSGSSDEGSSSDSGGGTWDSTPKVLTPEASGTDTLGNDTVDIDVSHASDGYMMVNYTGDNPRVKLEITKDGAIYYYDLQPDLYGSYETFTFTLGGGSYKVTVHENAGGTSYSQLVSGDVDVSLGDEYKPFRYPNQTVWFDSGSSAVAEAARLASSGDDELDVIENVFNYMVENISYDYDKADTVNQGGLAGYIPDPDRTLAEKKGICYDYASLMAAMLRSQGIPAQLVKGNADGIYHAWLNAHSEEQGEIDKVIAFDGAGWTLMDPTFSATAGSVSEYVGRGTTYNVQEVF